MRPDLTVIHCMSGEPRIGRGISSKDEIHLAARLAVCEDELADIDTTRGALDVEQQNGFLPRRIFVAIGRLDEGLLLPFDAIEVLGYTSDLDLVGFRGECRLARKKRSDYGEADQKFVFHSISPCLRPAGSLATEGRALDLIFAQAYVTSPADVDRSSRCNPSSIAARRGSAFLS